MSEIRNVRDQILQAAVVRTEPVVLPPTVIVPPGQIGAGSLSDAVKGANGATLIHQGNFQAQTVIANQIDSRGLTIKDSSGRVVFAAGTQLNTAEFGFGALASENLVNLATQTVGKINGQTQVTNLGSLAYADVVTAEAVAAGSFFGKTFTGGIFKGSTFEGITVKSSDLLEAFDVRATGTSTIYNLTVTNDIYCPNADINTLNIAATNDVRTRNLYVSNVASFANLTASNDIRGLNLYSTGTLTVSGSTVLASVSAGSLTSSGNVVAANDLRAPNIYSTSLLNIDGRLAGSTGSRIPLQNQNRWATLVIDGQAKVVTINFGDVA